eukprot:6605503-Prymnesium_polylepis.1
MLAQRPPRTTTTTARPGCRTRRPHPRDPTDSNRTLRGGRGSLPSTLSMHPFLTVRCTSSFPSSSLQLERRTARRTSLRPARDDGGQRVGTLARPHDRSFVHGEARRSGSATLLSSHGRPSCLVSQPFTLASFLPAQAGATQLPRTERAGTLAVPTTTPACC